VFVTGAERSGLGGVVDGPSQHRQVVARRIDAGIMESTSDHYAVERVGIPFLFYTTRRDRHYHTPQDTPEKLDYAKMVGLADHLTDLMYRWPMAPRRCTTSKVRTRQPAFGRSSRFWRSATEVRGFRLLQLDVDKYFADDPAFARFMGGGDLR